MNKISIWNQNLLILLLCLVSGVILVVGCLFCICCCVWCSIEWPNYLVDYGREQVISIIMEFTQRVVRLITRFLWFVILWFFFFCIFYVALFCLGFLKHFKIVVGLCIWFFFFALSLINNSFEGVSSWEKLHFRNKYVTCVPVV